MNATASTIRTLHVSRLHLVTAASAVAVAREFVHMTLRHWKLDDYAADAALMMSELVSNAVKATGFFDRQPMPWEISTQHVMAIQLRAVGDELYIEVWDRSLDEPVKQTVTADAEGGRGLHLVEALSKNWGIYRPPAGGKIVWAMIATVQLPNPALDGSTLQLRVPDDLKPQDGPVKDQASIALMQRVLDGLCRLL
ncbi:anti-sigma regulatory factor (Ser/Thr protein kinase) [Streptomyces turgidiscabies]|uniref:Anti-sigma regulatory factor (Ser/Thr protein kinase) n=1 Tax=Streptomyces turgidiscabies TaxID=85558 RepID=A0ABU0RVK8_9ACTN|nr:anti-sigma regulatory factor (Ser/Thr protein kinase) [Streptomyces turgidiscabies]